MSNHYLLNGKIFSLDQPGISIESRALRYGEGIFETIRMHQGKMPFFKMHMERMFAGMETLQLKPPPFTGPEKIQQQIESLVSKNKSGQHARVRISCLGKEGGVWDRTDAHADIIIQTWSLPDNYREFNTNGLIVDICMNARKSADILSNLKSNNYLPYLYAANEGRKLKVNDMLLLNYNEYIVDSTIANVFVVKDNIILTPMLEDGPVAGVMRRWILETLSGDFSIREQHISINDLLNADEVFLTNAAFGLRWVQRIKDNEYGNLMAQKIYHQISKHFQEGVV